MCVFVIPGSASVSDLQRINILNVAFSYFSLEQLRLCLEGRDAEDAQWV